MMSLVRRARRGLRYWRLHGARGFFDELRRRLAMRGQAHVAPITAAVDSPNHPPRLVAPAPVAANPAPTVAVPSARQLITSHFLQLQPLPVFTVPRSGSRRITIVTDSISSGSFAGGVGTALLLGALLAKARGARLRLVTRQERAVPSMMEDLFSLYGVEFPEELEFAFSTIWQPDAPPIDVFEDELFVSTSWWSTSALLASIPRQRVLYLCQEDERSFYPLDDMHLRAIALLTDALVPVAVNTQRLLDHLTDTGLSALTRQAVAFEPAFPLHVYARRPKPAHSKRTFAFYARPQHPRNLFYLGLEVIDAALGRGLIDTERWDIVLLGSNIPDFEFCDGTRAICHEKLTWQQYAELAGTIDLALSLMYSPHPSYPPLDLAASGAVVVTNRFGNKTDMTAYSDNIIVAEAAREPLLQALCSAMVLVDDEPRRQQHYEAQKLARDWAAGFAPVLHRFSGGGDVWA